MVIAVIAILAAIILPNISDMTAKATVSAIKGNARNIQTASDMYSYDFGNKATLTQPEYGVPKQFDYNKLYPDYLRKNCKDIKENYWVDNNGIVQGSVIKPPKVNELSGISLTWENSLNAVSYNVYKDVNGKQVLFNENAVSPVTVEAGGVYFVSAVDRYNFETPAVSYKYDPSNDEKNCTHSGTDTGNPNDGNDTETPTDGENVIKVGDFLVLGEYNGQPLEWVVLRSDSNGLYLFNASNVLKELVYDAQRDSTWETSDAREFLNNEFYNNSFNSYEKSLIKSSSYKTYVANESVSDGGSDMLYYSYDWVNVTLESNEDEAYYRYVTDNICLPSVTDGYTTDLFLYTFNMSSELHSVVSIYTRDAYHLDGFVYSLDVNYDGYIIAGREYTWYDDYARPVMYIKSNAVPTSGNGTNESPYVFDRSNTTSPVYTKLIKKYDDIIVTDDMFPSTMVGAVGDHGKFIKTIKLDVPEEYEEEMLLLSMTLEKTHEGRITLMQIYEEADREEYDKYGQFWTTAKYESYMSFLRQKSLMEIKDTSTGTLKLFYKHEIDFPELDLLVGRISDNTHGFKLTNIKLEQLIYK